MTLVAHRITILPENDNIEVPQVVICRKLGAKSGKNVVKFG
jgi:hypothetical protein